MSIVESMSEPERQSWVTFIADGLVFIWFWKTIAPGWSLNPINFSPSETGGLFLKLIIVAIFYNVIIGAVFALRRRHSGVDRDERDVVIQSFGSRVGYMALQFGVGLLMIGILLSYVMGGDFTGSLNLTRPLKFSFSLVFISYLADLLRHGVIIARYRFV